MIIGVDVDGVIAALHLEWLRRYNRDYDDDMTIARVTGWDMHKFVKPECGKKLYDYLTDPTLYDDVPVIEGALWGVNELRGMGHKIFYATSCAFGMTDQKAMWLIRHGFSQSKDDRGLPHDFVGINDKQLLRADMLIDDAAHQIKSWVESNRRAVLFEYPYNKFLLDEVPSPFWNWCGRASDWNGIVRHIKELGK